MWQQDGTHLRNTCQQKYKAWSDRWGDNGAVDYSSGILWVFIYPIVFFWWLLIESKYGPLMGQTLLRSILHKNVSLAKPKIKYTL